MDIHYSRRAQRDIKQLDAGTDRRRVLRGIREGLEEEAPNADIRSIRKGLKRLRIGDYRILFIEIAEAGREGALVVRVIHRSDLRRAVADLPF